MFSYCLQNFPFPDSIIYYFTKYPSTPEAYQKLIKTCKYFFAKNPILVFDYLFFENDGWKTSLPFTDNEEKLEINNIATSKLWITEHLYIRPKSLNFCNIASWLIQNKLFLHKSNKLFLSLVLIDQSISLNELAIFKHVSLYNVSVKNDNGDEAELQNIVSKFTDSKDFIFEFGNNSVKCSKGTVEKLINIPNFSKITWFTLKNIPETFDIEIFYEYLKKNKCMSAVLKFSNSISVQYRSQLERIANEILRNSVDSDEYVPLVISYDGQDPYTQWELGKKQKIFDGRYTEKELKKTNYAANICNLTDNFRYDNKKFSKHKTMKVFICLLIFF